MPATSPPATTPSAVHAPCADYRPVILFARATTAPSPDCRWEIISLGVENKSAGVQLGIPATDIYNAFVVDRRTHKVIYRFEMEHVAYVHWLRDGHYLVINEQGGPGENSRPLVFKLTTGPMRLPLDLSTLVVPDALRRARMRPSRTYTDVTYMDGPSEHSKLSVGLRSYDPASGMETGNDKCYIYYRQTADFHRYRFREQVHAATCSPNSDEE